MDSVERDKIRKLHSSEYFTPFEKVLERLDAYDESVWKDLGSQFLDPTCGDGQFLGEVLIRKVENGISFEQALQTIYGVDLMIDNVDFCRERLLCGRTDLRHIVEQNIVCADALKYKYNFPPMTPARQKKEDSARRRLQKNQEKAKKEEELRRKTEEKIKLQKKFFGEPLSV